MLFAGIGVGLWLIIAGVVVEPPAAVLEFVNKTNARLSRAVRTSGNRMSMVTNTLGRYFAGRFVVSALGVFVSYLRAAGAGRLHRDGAQDIGIGFGASPIMVAETSLFRVPQLLEKMMPFCVLIGAMTCYLALSRRLELVVARAAGVSAWQFIAPALASAIILGILATVAYNPMSANLRELSKRMESELFGGASGGGVQDAAGFWINQVNEDGQVDHERCAQRTAGRAAHRIDAVPIRYSPRDHRRWARGQDRLQGTHRGARRDARGRLLVVQGRAPILARLRRRSMKTAFKLATTLTSAQVRSSFSTPETVSFLATAGLHSFVGKFGLRHRRLSTAVSQASGTAIFARCNGDVGRFRVCFRFFRFGGVQKMVLSGVGAGFLLYVLSKVTEDLSKAELMHPIAAAWLPVTVGGLTGFLALLYQEDG